MIDYAQIFTKPQYFVVSIQNLMVQKTFGLSNITIYTISILAFLLFCLIYTRDYGISLVICSVCLLYYRQDIILSSLMNFFFIFLVSISYAIRFKRVRLSEVFLHYWAVTLYIFTVCLTSFINLTSVSMVGSIRLIIFHLLSFTLALLLVRSNLNFKQMLVFLFINLQFYYILSIVLSDSKSIIGTGSVVNSFTNQTAVGMFFAQVFMFGDKTANKINRLMFYAAVSLSLLICVLSASRTAIILILLSLFLYLKTPQKLAF